MKDKYTFGKIPNNRVKDLQHTCKIMSTCIPGSSYTPTKFGGVFKKGNRSISCEIDYNKKFDSSVFNIVKTQNGFGVKVDKNSTRRYYAIKKSICKGLGVEDNNFM